MPYRHIYFNEATCNGCNTCVRICMCDCLAPNPVKGGVPIEAYPDECWFCGCCVSLCPHQDQGAITLNTPFPMRGGFKLSASNDGQS